MVWPPFLKLEESAVWYQCSLADWKIGCDVPYPLTIGAESKPFVVAVSENVPHEPKTDRVLRMKPTDQLDFSPEEGFWSDNRCYQREGNICRTCYYAAPRKNPYACVMWDLQRPEELICHYIPEKVQYINQFRNVFQLLSTETLLLEMGGMILHASFISWNGKGILFSAPSGTGKSTQAELWVQHCNAEILNGDRAALRAGADGWVAYGLPFAGSSGIYRNEHVPLTAIVLLGQASENTVARVRPAQAVRTLYPEVSKQSWDADWAARTIDLLTQLVTEVPVYRLDCRPDVGAVECLKKVLQENRA